jgi:hypothetical protein
MTISEPPENGPASFCSRDVVVQPQHDNTPICPARISVGRKRRAGPKAVRDAFAAADKSYPDLSQDGKSQGRPAQLGHTKIESTVRYLGIEVDDALAIAEQVDV